MSGKYIVIEGHDGTGKSTQADLLQAHLESQGLRVIHTKEPGGSPMGEAIRSVLLNGNLQRQSMTNILLFTANRHELWHALIKPALDAGTWVIATRNYYSSLAFQGYGEGYDLDAIIKTTARYTDPQYMSPDMSVILTLGNEAERAKRIADRGELKNPDPFETKGDAFQRRVQDAYETIAATYTIPTIDASQSIEQVAVEVNELLARQLQF